MLKHTEHSCEYDLYTTTDGKQFTSKHDALKYTISLKYGSKHRTGAKLWLVHNVHRPEEPEIYSSLELAELSLKCVPNKNWYEILEVSVDAKFVDDHINDNVVYPEVTITDGSIKFIDKNTK